MDPFTTALHADSSLRELPDVAPPIRPSTTFLEGTGRRYRRTSHETTERFESVVGALEGGHAVAYASGMAAVAAVVDHVRPARVYLPEVYHGVRMLFESRERSGHLVLVNRDELGSGDLEWVESPSNPKCLITDVAATAEENRDRGTVTAIDATFATPVLLRALPLGADFVVHSATKAIGGHSDTHAGVVAVGDEHVAAELRDEREYSGAVPGSLDVWLALRGIRTLPLRMQRASDTAMTLAEWTHGQGIVTYYPGLPSHDGHAVAAREMSAFGSMLAIDVGSADLASDVVSRVSVFTNATSLGGVESLIEHRSQSDPGIDPGLIRISVGLEDPSDLIDDLAHALGS